MHADPSSDNYGLVVPLALLVLCVVVANRELAALGSWIAALEAGVCLPIQRSTELLLRISDFGAARSALLGFSCDFVCFAALLLPLNISFFIR